MCGSAHLCIIFAALFSTGCICIHKTETKREREKDRAVSFSFFLSYNIFVIFCSVYNRAVCCGFFFCFCLCVAHLPSPHIPPSSPSPPVPYCILNCFVHRYLFSTHLLSAVRCTAGVTVGDENFCLLCLFTHTIFFK